MTDNPFAKSLAGKPRRRTAGESAGGTTAPASRTPDRAGEKRIAVDVPVSLYTATKILAAEQDTTVKEILVAALTKEVAARRGQQH